jgi:hypothetical protein
LDIFLGPLVLSGVRLHILTVPLMSSDAFNIQQHHGIDTILERDKGNNSSPKRKTGMYKQTIQ